MVKNSSTDAGSGCHIECVNIEHCPSLCDVPLDSALLELYG